MLKRIDFYSLINSIRCLIKYRIEHHLIPTPDLADQSFHFIQ